MSRHYKQDGVHFEEVSYKDIFERCLAELLSIEKERPKGTIQDEKQIVEFTTPNNKVELAQLIKNLLRESDEEVKNNNFKEADKYARTVMRLQLINFKIESELKIKPIPEVEDIKISVPKELEKYKTKRGSQLQELLQDLSQAKSTKDYLERMVNHYSKIMLSGGMKINLGFAKVLGSELAEGIRVVCKNELGVRLPETLENNKPLTLQSGEIEKTDKYYLLTNDDRLSPRKERHNR